MRGKSIGTRWAAAAAIGCFLMWGPASAADRGADGEFEKRQSSHFILYQDVDIDETSGFHGSRRFEQRLLEVLESAYDQMDNRLGLRPDGPITVVVYDPQIFQSRFSGLFRFPAAGFYGGRVHVRGDTQVTAALSRVLHHELVHAAVDSEISSRGLPGWFNEGVAEWFEARTTGKRGLSVRERLLLQPLARSGSLPSLAQLSVPSFGRFGPDLAHVAYLESYGFIAFLASEYSESRLRDWIREIARTQDIDKATRRKFRSDLQDLEARYRQELSAGGR